MAQRWTRLRLVICAWIAVAGGASVANAADLDFAGALTTSSATGDSSGTNTFFPIKGDDTDSAPVYGGTLGIGFRLNEMNPDGWGADLPPWTLRLEIEGLYGRDYEFKTGAGTASYFSEIESWTLTPAAYLEVPVQAATRPLFGRIPVLEPLSIYAGAGMGLAHMDYKTTDNILKGTSDDFNFTWHASGGIAYELTEWVTLTAGYRYVDLGTAETKLVFAPGFDPGKHDIDITAHEFTSSLRIDYHTEPLDDLIPERWAWPKIRLPKRFPSFRRPRWLGGR